MRVRKCFVYAIVMGLAGILLGGQVCFGAGFALYEGSARGNALGGTLVARADDASALFYNPAGITQLPGLQVMGGATFIIPGTDVTTTNPYNKRTTKTGTESNVWMPPHLYASYQFSDKLWFGLGVFGQFGLGTEFDSLWSGRYNSYDAEIKTLTFNPNFAFKVTDSLSLAAGIDFMWFDLTLKNKIDASGQNNPATYAYDVDQKLTGDSINAGWNVALHYKPLNWMAFGMSYRSQVKQNVTGDANFTKPSFLNPLVFQDTSVAGSITLPDTLYSGLMFKPWNCFSVEIGGTWVRWSTYDQLTIQYDNAIAYDSKTGKAITQVTRIKDWHDTWRASIGFEYTPIEWLDLRAGYIFDESPVTDEHADYLLPANSRHIFSFGPGFRWRNWTLDLSYQYIWILDRDNVPARLSEGVLQSSFSGGYANLVGLSVGYKF